MEQMYMLEQSLKIGEAYWKNFNLLNEKEEKLEAHPFYDHVYIHQ